MTESIGFILCPNFAMMSAAAAVEPLRAANLLGKKPLYKSVYLSPQGGWVSSSCGGGFNTLSFEAARDQFSFLFVVAGANPFSLNVARYSGFLRKAELAGRSLGGISGGAVLLAKIGLMKNRRFTVHWEHLQTLREEDPDHLIEKRLFVIDRDRATCAGGVAPLDMMHALIMARHGSDLANAVSDWFIHTGIRSAEAPQRRVESLTANCHPAITSALRLMDDNIADPISLDRIARLSGLSGRQLQRQFQAEFGQSVMQHYQHLRLRKADELLRQSRLSLSQVALATGYSNQSNFTRSYKHVFEKTPAQTRRAEI